MATPTSPPGDSRRRTTVTKNSTPKLRDSCEACAAAKLRCSKEKPSCARCTRRGRNCEYLATRRTGRRTFSKKDTPRPTEPAQVPTPPTTIAPEALRIDKAAQTPEQQYGENTPDGSSSPDMGSEPYGLMTPADMDLGMPDFLTSPSPFHIPELSDEHSRIGSIGSSLSDWTMNYPFDNDNSAPIHGGTLMNNAISHVQPPLTYQSMPSASGPAPSPELKEPNLLSKPPELHCGCHARAHELLGHFCSGASPSRPATTNQDGFQTMDSCRSIHSVVLFNQNAISAITNILACSCSQDSFLLITLSLVLLRIMDHYERAACDPPMISNKSNNSTLDVTAISPQPSLGDLDYCYVVSEDPSREGAYTVLGEMRLVQHVCRGLTLRLQNMAVQKPGKDTFSDSSASHVVEEDLSKESLFASNIIPFMPALLHQLDADLRKRLRNLSTAVARQLIKP
ncbi:hypothetical protein G7054_g1797 [Neopestalotiopsis clavispora]|nr:hypothetical protein G7054_g1797 [Neopestalotiopsis clavispora]